MILSVGEYLCASKVEVSVELEVCTHMRSGRHHTLVASGLCRWLRLPKISSGLAVSGAFLRPGLPRLREAKLGYHLSAVSACQSTSKYLLICPQ